jgi:hypothetical protein
LDVVEGFHFYGTVPEVELTLQEVRDCLHAREGCRCLLLAVNEETSEDRVDSSLGNASSAEGTHTAKYRWILMPDSGEGDAAD